MNEITKVPAELGTLSISTLQIPPQGGTYPIYC